jgi:hypothetical protein
MASPPEPRHDPTLRSEGAAGRSRRRRPGGRARSAGAEADPDVAPDSEESGTEQLEGDPQDLDEGGDDEDEEHQARAPWHFKVMVVGSVVYLGYRLYQGISWLAHHI